MAIKHIGLLLSLVLLAIAAFHDLKSRKIPNLLVWLAIAAGAFVCGWQYRQNKDIADLAGRIILFMSLFALIATRAFGMGDIKLMQALALLNPSKNTLIMILAACLITILVSYIINPKRTKKALKSTFKRKKTHTSTGELPFAPMLFGGYIVNLIAASISCFL